MNPYQAWVSNLAQRLFYKNHGTCSQSITNLCTSSNQSQVRYALESFKVTGTIGSTLLHHLGVK